MRLPRAQPRMASTPAAAASAGFRIWPPARNMTAPTAAPRKTAISESSYLVRYAISPHTTAPATATPAPASTAVPRPPCRRACGSIPYTVISRPPFPGRNPGSILATGPPRKAFPATGQKPLAGAIRAPGRVQISGNPVR
jgi:hypothetical protein